MLKGQKEAFHILKAQVDPNSSYIWIHVASLGEFEQGRPLIEAIKQKDPSQKVLLTFFSPSGYEVRKDYPLADVVCYLPLDSKRKAKKFLKLVSLQKAIFIKYDFWYHYTYQLTQKGVNTYVVAAKFRKNQIFFKWYGGFMRRLLKLYTCICVQDEDSKTLLHNIGVNNVAVTGDTRFDRVLQTKKEDVKNNLLNLFIQKRNIEKNEFVLVVGSSWPKDEDLVIPYFNTHLESRLIIAPHELSESHLTYIESLLKRPSIRCSNATEQNVQTYDCIILDSIGMLSHVYKYGNIAYVGGGFGVGIHNILEAAVYHMPVIFGPNFKKFKEAYDLIDKGGAYSVKTTQDFKALMDEFTCYPETLNVVGECLGS